MSSATTARIAFITPRYGRTVVGGAETLCRLLAENLTTHGTRVDVLTTCATDHFTWRNDLAEGTTVEGGVTVRRFPIGARNPDEFNFWHAVIDCGARIRYGEQVSWMANSAWAPGIIDAAGSYDWVVAMPYLFGTTFWAAVADPDRTVIIPCLHDEAHARQPVVLDALCTARGLMLNATGEAALVERLLSTHRGGTMAPRHTPHIVGAGFDEVPEPTPAEVDAFCRCHGAEPGYVLYAGRRERAKGLITLFDNYRVYRSMASRPRKLALMGSGDTQPPDDIRPHVIDLGFVPLEERAAAYAAAAVLVQPSRLESFGMVLFESWLAGTPALVNGASDVLRQHCEMSGGGLWFSDAATFAEALTLLTEEQGLALTLAAAGREYTLSEFRWDAVRARFTAALEAWA